MSSISDSSISCIKIFFQQAVNIERKNLWSPNDLPWLQIADGDFNEVSLEAFYVLVFLLDAIRERQTKYYIFTVHFYVFQCGGFPCVESANKRKSPRVSNENFF